MTSQIQMRCDATSELAPAHLLGTSDDGRKVYQAVEGWELVSADGQPVAAECDSDGNYLVS